MRSESTLVKRVRELMEPSNPVPATRYQGEVPYQAEIAAVLSELRSDPPAPAEPEPVGPARDQPGRRPGRDLAWRVLAPVLSGLAVVAVVTSLTVAARPEPSRPSSGPKAPPAAAALPRFFGTLVGRPALSPALQIHRTSTGRVVAKLPFQTDLGPVTVVAASSSGRAFYVSAELRNSHQQLVIVVYKAQLSAQGHWTIAELAAGKLIPQTTNTLVNGIAISPDGTRLALAVQQYITARTHTRMIVIPLNGKGAARVWSAPSVPAIALDPVWTDNHDLAFLWQDHLTGSAKFGGRGQERVLDTSLPGSDLRAAKVLVSTDAGLMETAFASPHGGPVFATLANDVPPKGTSGTATVRLVWFTPHQPGFTILAMRKIHYNSLPGRDKADLFYQVLALDRSGQHALVDSPDLGVMNIFKIRSLRGVGRSFAGAAW